MPTEDLDIYDITDTPSKTLEPGQYWEWNASTSPASWVVKTDETMDSASHAAYLARAQERARVRSLAV